MSDEPMTKVDRALEKQVIDWLQWAHFPYDQENLAALALELISKRKKGYGQLNSEVERLKAENSELRLNQPYAGSTDTLTEKYQLRRERDQMHGDLNKMTIKAASLELMAESYRAKLVELIDTVERYSCKGLIENYVHDSNKMKCLSDVIDEAREVLSDRKAD